jgi:hypothetical protein
MANKNIKFINEFTFEERCAKYKILKTKYPTMIPIIVEHFNSDIKELPKNKFLISNKEVFSSLAIVIRKYINVSQSKAMFFYVNNKIINFNDTINDLYNKYKNEDGFLYVEYAYENTFGGQFKAA